MKKDIPRLSCFMDDFVKGIQEEITSQGLPFCESTKNPTRVPALTDREIGTIILMF